MKKKALILGIESSCDETSVSLVQENNIGNPSILSNIVSSQVEIHKEYGGVVPDLASKDHEGIKNTDAFKELEQYVAEFTGA